MAGPSSLTIHTLCGMASRASRRRASPSSRGNLGSTEGSPAGPRSCRVFRVLARGEGGHPPHCKALRLLGLRRACCRCLSIGGLQEQDVDRNIVVLLNELCLAGELIDRHVGPLCMHFHRSLSEFARITVAGPDVL